MKILFATDGSDHSKKAAKFLEYFAFSPQDEITVLHALGWVPFMEDSASYHENLTRMKNEIGPRLLDAATRSLERLGAKITTALIAGNPHEAIVEQATDANVDVIVMGARGLKGVASIVIGSVTRAVAISSPRPVLVVKPMPWETGDHLKILVATDGSEHARAVVHLLRSLPFRTAPDFMIAAVIKPLRYEMPESAFTDELEKELEAAAMVEVERAKQIIGETQRDLGARLGVIRIGDPLHEILDRAEVHRADLIAVGSRGLRGVEGMIGSVSRGILGRANASVLIGK